MIWVQLFIFLGVSQLTVADTVHPNVGVNRDCLNKVPGVAKINYYREGFICSGVHLKPWIVLTIANCVNKRKVEKLSVTVKIYPSHEKDVEVKSIDFDPNFYHQKKQNNLALLYIYGQMEWCVGRFYIPPKVFTKDVILSGQYPVLINEWIMTTIGDLEVKSSFMNTTKDYGECGTVEQEDLYCGKKKGLNNYKINTGMPFYFSWTRRRGLLGLYTGTVLSKNDTGSLFQAVLPSYIWIHEYIHEHPAPNA